MSTMNKLWQIVLIKNVRVLGVESPRRETLRGKKNKILLFRVGLTVFIVLMNIISYGQSYFIVDSFQEGRYYGACRSNDCYGDVDSSVTLVKDSNGKPLSVDVSITCAGRGGNGNFIESCNYDLSSDDCYSDDNISWRPDPSKMTILSNSSSPGIYCPDQKITLNAPNVYNSYVWQYSVNGGTPSNLPLFTGASISVGLSDLPNATFGQNINFWYYVSGCGSRSSVSNVYSFSFKQLKANINPNDIKPISCAGLNDGELTVTSFDRIPYPSETIIGTFLYRSKADPNAAYSASGNKVTGIAPGSYYILVASQIGSVNPCGAVVFSDAQVTFSPPPSLSATAAVTSNYNGKQISCSTATDGAITVTASGGTGTLQYRINSGSYQSSNVFSGLGAGNYTIGVMDSNGCTLSLANPVQISSPTPVAVGSFIKTDALCNGGKGTITISGGGGADGFGYEYSKDDGGSYQAGNIFSDLTSGIYQMRVKDKNNCVSNVQNIEITQPPAITFTGTTNATPTCFAGSDGSITINGASGGASGLQFSKDGTNFQSSNVFGSLAAGSYTIYAKDGNCPSVTLTSVTLDQPVAVSITSTSFTEPTCFGGKNGSITITSPTATQYSINGGTTFQASNTFNSNISSGNYSVMVKDAKGCQSAIEIVHVTEPSPITATISQTASIQCYGQFTELSVTPSGGTAPYTYAWSNGVSTQNNTNVVAGSYSVTITDSKTCTGTASITISQPSALTVIPSASQITCKGSNNGSINLVVEGGTGVKTFLWSNGATTQNISSLPPGTYTVAVSDANGCVNNATSVTITEPLTSVSVSLQSKTNVTCFNASNGTIQVTGSGGTGTLTYSKDGINFQPEANFTGLGPGNYTITAKDANNCTQTTLPINISQPSSALTISGIVKNNPLCNGNSNGSLVVSVAGGTPPYQYSRDGTSFSSSSTIGGLLAGNYVVTVKDANNCTIVSTSQALVNPALLVATVTAFPQSCAAVVDGQLSVLASGGTGGLQYSINDTNFQTSSIFNGLLASNYTVTIKDANNCSITRLATVTTVPAIVGTISQTAFINCFGQSTAALNLSVTGGTGPFTFLWSNNATTQNINTLPVGNYSVTMRDSKGCTSSASASITQPNQLSATTTISNYNGYGVTCNGSSTGFINLTIAGGTSPYSYAWSNGATVKDVSSLPAGTYSVTITDLKNCTATASASLTAPTRVTVSLSSKINVTCNSGNDGSVSLTASGGTGSFNYSKGGSTWQASNAFTQLSQGTYTFQARDQNSCVSPTPVTVSVTQPAAIVISFSGFQNANCGAADGAVQATASGGTGTLTYQWKDQSNNIVGNAALLSNVISGTYTVTVTDQSSCTRTAVTSVGGNGGAVFTVGSIASTSCFNSTDGKAQVAISNGLGPFSIIWGSGETGISAIQLPGGSNSVTVKDAANCSVSSSFVVPSPSAISLSSINKTSPDCVGGSNGSIQVVATGGNGGYLYQWDGASGTNVLSGITSGNYALQITDSKNCSFSQTIALVDPDAITISTVNQIAPLCASSTDGSIQVSASGGNGTFTYLWNTGATGASVNGLAGGTYTVTAIDAKACTDVKSIPLEAPPELSLTVVSATPVSCFGGSNGTATLAASGGVGSYQYSINQGSTWQPSINFSDLPAGNIGASTKDANGCIATTSLSIAQPSALLTTVNSTINTTCGLANGSAAVTGSGGTLPYQYQWLNAANQVVASTHSLQNASAGNYQALTTDANLCTSISTATIAPSTNVNFSITNVAATKCATSSDGSAEVSNITGKEPYVFLWSSGETVAVATKLIAGGNTIKVTDADGCFLQQTFSVASPMAISLISETVFQPVCAGGNGSIQVTAAGGTLPYSFTWNDQPSASFIQNIKAGNYQLKVKDANECIFTKSFSMTEPPAFTIDVGPDRKICTGGTLTITAPVDATSYIWSSADGFKSIGKQVALTKSGVYTLKVTNANGCVAEDAFVLTTTNDLLKADFLMSSMAHVGDTVMVVDISWPLPERIQWYLPTEAKVLFQSQDYASLVFDKEGKYAVKLTANSAECQSEYLSQIEIIKGDETSGSPLGGELIKALEVFPNPSAQGFVTVKVELSELAPLHARVVSLSGNKIVADFTDSGKNAYEFELRWEDVSKGVYFLVVEVKDQKRVVRILIIY
jgi:hypothetical protein